MAPGKLVALPAETGPTTTTQTGGALSQAEVEQSRKAFRAFDRDGSGTIDVGELRAALAGMGQAEISDEELYVMISQVGGWVRWLCVRGFVCLMMMLALVPRSRKHARTHRRFQRPRARARAQQQK
jgi:hypothetical protein